jgi:hypothetical protein
VSLLFAAGVALCGGAAMAQAVDKPESTEFRQALVALQAQGAAVVAARQALGQSDGHCQRAPDPSRRSCAVVPRLPASVAARMRQRYRRDLHSRPSLSHPLPLRDGSRHRRCRSDRQDHC